MDMDAATATATALRAELFGSVFLLVQHLARRGDRALAGMGITTRQWLLLAVLAKKFPGVSPTLTEAARWYGSSRQNVKKIAEQLEAAGYLRIAPDPEDRRALRLHRTAAVDRFDEPGNRVHQASFLREALNGLPRDDLRELHRLIARWLEAVFPRGAPTR